MGTVGESASSCTKTEKSARIRIVIGKRDMRDRRRTTTKIDSSVLHTACNTALSDPKRAASCIIRAIGGVQPALVCEIAGLCLEGRLGRIGQRRTMRIVANELLERLIADRPHYTRALCMLGEAILPIEHGGRGGPGARACALEDAYTMFSRAASLGCAEGEFLKGRFEVTTASSHESVSLADGGLKRVRRAAARGISRAYIFLAICHEYPTKYTKSVLPSLRQPRSKRGVTGAILDMYVQAAGLGDAAAVNDVGTSIAMGYADLRADFDAAARHYACAVRAGYIDALDNIATHYESGMDGGAVARVDIEKALLYHAQGALLRSAGCARNVARYYNEGIPGVLEADADMAAYYYKIALWLGDDAFDFQTCNEVLKDLCALYVCRFKMCGKVSGESAKKELLCFLNIKSVRVMLNEVDEAVFKALMGRKKKVNSLLGVFNAGKLLLHCKRMLNSTLGDSPVGMDALEHLFGRRTKQLCDNWKRNARHRKRR